MGQDWSRPPPRPLKIPDVMDLKTLADERGLICYAGVRRRLGQFNLSAMPI
jgi:hypothetical protein